VPGHALPTGLECVGPALQGATAIEQLFISPKFFGIYLYIKCFELLDRKQSWKIRPRWGRSKNGVNLRPIRAGRQDQKDNKTKPDHARDGMVTARVLQAVLI